MDDPRPTRVARERRSTSHQRVEQRIVPVTGRRMHHEPGGFVDDEQLRVVIHDGNRMMIRRDDAWRRRVGHVDFNDVTMLEGARRPRRGIIDDDAPRGNQTSGETARQRELVCDEAIESLGGSDTDAETRGGDPYASAASAGLGTGARCSSCPSCQSTMARAMAPHVTAISATLNVGQCSGPM